MIQTTNMHIQPATQFDTQQFDAGHPPGPFVAVRLLGSPGNPSACLLFRNVADIERLVAELQKAGNALAAMQPEAKLEACFTTMTPAPAAQVVFQFTAINRDVPALSDAQVRSRAEREAGMPIIVHDGERLTVERIPGDAIMTYKLVREKILGGEQSRPLPSSTGSTPPDRSPSGSGESAERMLPNETPAGPDDVPAATCDCGAPVRGPGTLWCAACYAKLDKVIPF